MALASGSSTGEVLKSSGGDQDFVERRPAAEEASRRRTRARAAKRSPVPEKKQGR